MAVARRTRATNSTDRPRQLPGSACEECRKRRVRCDRQKPQCGTCAETGVSCQFSTVRLARGPKKGELKALRSRVVAIERRLSLEHPIGELEGQAIEPPTTASIIDASIEFSQFPSPSCQRSPSWDDVLCAQMAPMTPASMPPSFAAFRFPSPSPPSPKSHALVDDLMREDLDQLYFERVHPTVPIFNQTRYISRSRQLHTADVPKHLLCLQSSMWTLAMAFSSQFDGIRNLVYRETRQTLEALDMEEVDMGSVRVEHVQAYLLLAFYEFARCQYRCAWITAGRAFRLVQLAKLHLLDSGEHAARDEDPISREEKRRTFWVAYCLDHLLSIRNRCPLTLVEGICTRLPSPDLAFQSGHPIDGYFVDEAITSGDRLLSPLAESAILVTICGPALSQRCRSYGDTFLDFSMKQDWLSGMVTSLSVSSSGISGGADSMQFFALMMAHHFRITMCEIVESMRAENRCHFDLFAYQTQAIQAASEIARLAKTHEHLGFVKAHIFLPWAISSAASRLMTHSTQCLVDMELLSTTMGNHPPGTDRVRDSVMEGELQYCMDALRKMQRHNNLARDHLSILESTDFALRG
ncbi:pyrimidine pathway regulatory protein 1 [Podospora australis]|uniref:Pyrimidine pathway regulatory protein 1 n=1 Tax=Podospora australis TaxID=1536484 RepID=A0AAN7ADN5_9PEZI|nr:pyrimidine pathway regulatory protein 1 [Podospora australis]